jgi:hypothetical protein
MLLSETCTQGAIFVRAFTVILWCSTCDLFFFLHLAQRLVNSKRRNLSFIYAECKDTWDIPRDPAGDLCSGSRGHCPIITRGLVALFFLFSYSIFLVAYCILFVYIVEVFTSSIVASFGSELAFSLPLAPLDVLRVVS